MPGPHPVVQLRGLRMMCLCGALPEEQDRRQPYEFDIDIEAAVGAATQSDDLRDTIDYGAVLDQVEHVIDNESFQLFERMAARVAEAILSDDRVITVTIEVRKLRPPVAQDLASSGLRLTVAR